jgi:hypothetical protein
MLLIFFFNIFAVNTKLKYYETKSTSTGLKIVLVEQGKEGKWLSEQLSKDLLLF